MKRLIKLLIAICIITTSVFTTVSADDAAFNASLAKVETMIDYLNEVYLGNDTLAFDIDYCSDADIELLQAVANDITKGCSTDEAKAQAIYSWMVSNINYSKYTSSFSPIDVYKNRQGLCSGHAQLMSTLFKLVGIRAAVVRASKQGTKNIESLELSNSFLYQYLHEFVMAYVDGGWYGYDSCWKWSKMEKDHIADQYVVLHVDGIMPYSDEAWGDWSVWKSIDTWYVDGEFLALNENGENIESGGMTMKVGGCLAYNIQQYNSSTHTYYIYQGTGTNTPGHAYLPGYYLTQHINTKDVILVDSVGMLEGSYFEYNGSTYFKGIKVGNCIPDLGLTNNKINLYVGEIIDFSSIYPGYTLKSSKLTIDGLTVTATTECEASLTITNGTKNYTINFYVHNFTLDSYSQSLCNHTHTHESGENTICSYCGKVIEVEQPKQNEEVKEQVVEQVQETTPTQEPQKEEVQEVLDQQQPISEPVQEQVKEEPKEQKKLLQQVIEEPVAEKVIENPIIEPIVEPTPIITPVVEPTPVVEQPIQVIDLPQVIEQIETPVNNIQPVETPVINTPVEEPVVEEEKVEYQPILLIDRTLTFHGLTNATYGELPTTITFETPISLEGINPTREGYTFEGWYRDRNYKYKVNQLVYNIVEEVYAKWSKNIIKVVEEPLVETPIITPVVEEPKVEQIIEVKVVETPVVEEKVEVIEQVVEEQVVEVIEITPVETPVISQTDTAIETTPTIEVVIEKVEEKVVVEIKVVEQTKKATVVKTTFTKLSKLFKQVIITK